jgi:hypothetical protein
MRERSVQNLNGVKRGMNEKTQEVYTPDEIEKQARRMKILEEFFQLNEIDANEAIALSMHFIAVQSADIAQYKFIETLFRKIWEAVQRGEI